MSTSRVPCVYLFVFITRRVKKPSHDTEVDKSQTPSAVNDFLCCWWKKARRFEWDPCARKGSVSGFASSCSTERFWEGGQTNGLQVYENLQFLYWRLRTLFRIKAASLALARIQLHRLAQVEDSNEYVLEWFILGGCEETQRPYWWVSQDFSLFFLRFPFPPLSIFCLIPSVVLV